MSHAAAGTTAVAVLLVVLNVPKKGTSTHGPAASGGGLRVLRLANNCLGDKGAEVIANMQTLARNASLTHLDLSYNGITAEGCLALTRQAALCFGVDAAEEEQPQQAEAEGVAGVPGCSTSGAAAARPLNAPNGGRPRSLLLDVSGGFGSSSSSAAGGCPAAAAAVRIAERVNAAAEAAGWRKKKMLLLIGA